MPWLTNHGWCMYFTNGVVYFSPVRQLCEMLTAPDNGDISVPSLLDGSFATYTCILGYILVGDSSRECLTNPDGIEEGDWSGDAPICRSKHLAYEMPNS